MAQHFGLSRLQEITMSPTEKFYSLRYLRRFHPIHRPFFFYSALQARSDLHLDV